MKVVPEVSFMICMPGVVLVVGADAPVAVDATIHTDAKA